MPEHPFLAEKFHIRWSQLVPEKVEVDIEAGILEAQQRIDEICSVPPEQLTYGNTFAALEAATESLSRGWGRLNHLSSVRDNDAQRSALNKMLPKVTAFHASIPLNAKLWATLKSFAESESVKNLDIVSGRFVEETCAEFRDAGADLPAEKKARMAQLQSELAEATKKFGENVLDSVKEWELVVEDEAMLAGLPESARASARADAEAKGLGSPETPCWRFNMQFPSFYPVLQYADSEELRKMVFEGRGSIGRTDKFDNSTLVWKIVELRQEKAELLGFTNFADLNLQRSMVGNGGRALGFIEDLHGRIVDAFQNECRQLENYKAQKTGIETTPLEPWEVSYWAEKQRKEQYDFDDEDLRPYFQVDNVMEGLFGLTSRLFGVTITPRQSVFLEPGASPSEDKIEVWHPEVSFYDLHDSESGELLGSFYADWHPRESKRSGAWMNYLETGLPGNGDKERKPHLGLITGNLTKPIGDQPALLTHSEVETIFHEFGHLLHQLLSDVPVKSLSGVNVPRDWVELPSQIMENFCWDRESLNFFARHHETGESIPEDLFQKMIAARNYLSASATMRQLALGKLDLELHIQPGAYLDRDLDEVDQKILKNYKALLASPTPTIARQFNHLFDSPGGYAAGYYSYKWSEVLDADAFTRFRAEGVLNPDTGRAFRDQILSKGNSRPVDELYRDFMGRDPELQPLLERNGLA
ncbi:MAG TPA: oligopeptidase A [Verrucomicrobiales bacterium]|nr:oligopeptidase A [Verrucomicrobiales bacterium]|tara:strand:+ start:1260 stop:3359 length:2100 start_codon:yes stop_codon:yes gene_type:complete